PGYWSWADTGYEWNPGYWAPQVGCYGGVDYGYGYFGDGYYGGRWDNDRFLYNTAFSNVGPSVNQYTYVNRTVIVNNRTIVVNNSNYNNGYGDFNNRRVSFNGGHGGIQARPNPNQIRVSHEKRFGPIAAQQRLVSLAKNEP